MIDTAERISIAFVEDDPIDRKALLKFVEQQQLPYDIIPLESFKAALTFLHQARCDLVLLDYDLRDGYGLDLLPHFLEQKVPVIFITGRGSEQLAVAAMRQGASDYLRKDTERNYLDFLPITINNVLSRSRAEQERDRLLTELQEAIETIKTLRGLIPICTCCKKIRDDDGFWHTVEEFVTEHSLAQFSHGYCPTCFENAKRELEAEKLLRAAGAAQA